jgi:transglutaminase-like putative cysteine protease
MHLFAADRGTLRIDYAAEVVGRAPAADVDPADAIRYLRPSRYVQSDTLTPFAREIFGGMRGLEAVSAVPDWVFGRLRYDADQSPPTGGAVETLETAAGVCRDFAHVTAALLRALDVPARLVSVYAPQLHPMDFHAVVEALVDRRWVVVDSTHLAPRRGMLRIATGRDATDTAFETNTLADVTLLTLRVQATADETFGEDPAELIELS